jgi:integrase/recombinase XerD
MRHTLRLGIYTREKTHKGWRYRRVKTGRGQKHSHLTGPFYLRPTIEGKRVWQAAKGSTLPEVMEEAETLVHGLNAAERGLNVSELDEVTNAHRTTIHSACEEFLSLKKSKAPRTLKAYTLHLSEFQESLDRRTRYLDDIDVGTMRRFKEFMTKKSLSGKTQHNRLLTVVFMLKKHGIKNPLGWDEFPTVEVEAAVPFESAELKTLFDANTTTDEDRIRYRFFLGTGAREQEVSYATWADLDLQKAVFHIRAKPEHGFTLKTHEARSVPMPASLVTALKERKKHAPHPRWLFVNKDGNPEGHFLKKLKRLALHAGLNCGHCVTETSEMTKEQRQAAFVEKFGTGKKFFENWAESEQPHVLKRRVTCKTHPVCEHIYLHRLRKTCATRWSEAGVPVRTIQQWLGHKDLATTMRYLGVADMHAPHMRQKIDQAFGD